MISGTNINLIEQIHTLEVCKINQTHSIVKKTNENLIQVIGIISSVQKNDGNVFCPKTFTLDNIKQDLIDSTLEISLINDDQLIYQRRSKNIVEILSGIKPAIERLSEKLKNNECEAISINGYWKVVQRVNDNHFYMLSDITPLKQIPKIKCNVLNQLAELKNTSSNVKLYNLNETKVIAKRNINRFTVLATVEPNSNNEDIMNAELSEIGGKLYFVNITGDSISIIAKVNISNTPDTYENSLCENKIIICLNQSDVLIRGDKSNFEIICNLRFINEPSSTTAIPTVYVPIKSQSSHN